MLWQAATRIRLLWVLGYLLGNLGFLTSVAFAEPLPLHERIDQAVESSAGVPLATLCTDGEFLRRLSLDLTGSVPDAATVKAFLADTSPDKRKLMVDRLLESPQFVRHMATTFDVMLTERRRENHVKPEEWLAYLENSFAQNKSWDRLVREILAADGSDEKIRPAAKFYLDRDGEPNAITRDIGRIFFGMDLACCQCHDHPSVNSYAQADYYGLYAFVSRGSLFTDKEKKTFYAEKAEGDVKFTSVFTKEQDETRPCLPGGFEIDEPVFLKGQEYTVAPADGIRPVPKYSRRGNLAELATSGANRQFNRNIANRLWALMMGRGLVEPLDMHHADNPATHPALLDLLAAEMVTLKYDMRQFLRELALTRTYQRSLQVPADLTPAIAAAAKELPVWEQRRQEASAAFDQLSEPLQKLRAEYDAARKGTTAVLAELATANGALGGAQKAAADANKALAEAQQQLTAKQEISKAVGEAAGKAIEAAAKLSGDTELALAAEKFKIRAEQLTAQVAAADKVVQERSPAAKSANDALAAAEGAANQIVAKLAAATQKQGELRQQLATLRDQRTNHLVALQAARAQVTRATSLQETAQVLAAADIARQQWDGLQAELAAARQQMVRLTGQLPQLETAMTASKAASDEAAQQLTAARELLTTHQQTLQVVTDAAAKAEIAVQKLPEDAELKQATETVKGRREKIAAEVAELQKKMPPLEERSTTLASQFTAAQQALASAQSQLETLRQQIPEKEKRVPAVQTAAEAAATARDAELRRATLAWSEQFGLATLEPLTPEQLAWSMLTVTGVAAQQQAAAVAEVNKTLPPDAVAADPAKRKERETQIEKQVYEKLKGHVASFVNLFGHAAGQPQRDFFATVDQALYFANAGVLQSWLNPSGENLLGRLIKLNEANQIADELYVSVFARPPQPEEVAAVTQYLQGRTADRQQALQEIAWALLTSNEFRFSH